MRSRVSVLDVIATTVPLFVDDAVPVKWALKEGDVFIAIYETEENTTMPLAAGPKA